MGRFRFSKLFIALLANNDDSLNEGGNRDEGRSEEPIAQPNLKGFIASQVGHYLSQ